MSTISTPSIFILPFCGKSNPRITSAKVVFPAPDFPTKATACPLLIDSEIQKKRGIIPYVLTGDEHCLDLRAFPDDMKIEVWEKQGHRCALCGKEFDIEFMEGDHITPWKEGGKTILENCQMLCRDCKRRKSYK